ncbi:hypothetical protein BXA16_06975 [Salmonella enterica subsp. enterica serovar Typhimurium]|nr:hypothetical protein BXA16_06975 [Salmonella enterica subsp. enterica serovar Typhimurium]
MSETLNVVTLLGSLRKGSFNGMVARTLPKPGGLKNAIDWLSRLPEQPLAGKPVLIQTSSMGAIGGARCQYHLRQILVFLDAMVMNKPEFMGGVIQNKVDPQTGEVVDQGTLDHLTGQLTAFGEFIQRVKA